MLFNSYFRRMKFLRRLLFPFSLLYGTVTFVRNRLFDIGWLKSHRFDLPVVCVGNLSTGGTGKSPMIEFLIQSFQDTYKLGVVSRGYKRKTKGYWEVFVNQSAFEVGDEPDRKSTRLNSSHVRISYAVFCLKKKKRSTIRTAIATLRRPLRGGDGRDRRCSSRWDVEQRKSVTHCLERLRDWRSSGAMRSWSS